MRTPTASQVSNNVRLTPAAYSALRKMADDEMRTLSAQASLLILQAALKAKP